jgi:glyoxylase-like metal-dependent hydrolase (beta-lactamase superfamily II)
MATHKMQWQVGEVKITRIIEMEQQAIPATFLYSEVSPAAIKREADWLCPYFSTTDGDLKLSIHSLVVESKGKRILVDTCIGNDKNRSKSFPEWSNLQLPYLADLKTAGYVPESIDYVLQTHLHVDHVGWNMMLKDGKWGPTFVNARYLIGGTEWDFFSTFEDEGARQPIEDSVRPVIEQGCAQLIESTHRITDEVWLEPSPGHTPGHHHVRISSGGSQAIITGDLMHHPVQCAYPEWNVNFDADTPKAKVTRRSFLESYADQNILIFGTHFASPSCGKIVRKGSAFRFIPQV